MEEIIIPEDLENDDYDFALPKHTFGSSFNYPSPEFEQPHSFSSHRTNPSSSSEFSFSRHATATASTTSSRPTLPKTSASYSVGTPPHSSSSYSDERRLGKFSNGSSSSIITAGTSISSSTGGGGFLAGRKGSFASLKNAFGKSSGASVPIPPVPSLDRSQSSAPGYPALRNPFSRFENSPASPSSSRPSISTSRSNAKTPSISASPGPSTYDRKQSIATSHTSNRSQGGRSVTSQGSSNFKGDDHPLPALPRIPQRSTQRGRLGSDGGSFSPYGRVRNGSLGEEDSFSRTPGEEALRVVFKDFKEVANGKVARICAKPLNQHPSLSAALEHGADHQFDALLISLAHCGHRHARRVVDLLAGWSRAHCEGIGAAEVRAHLSQSMGTQIRVEDAAAILGGRKSSAARYILNRALIELIKSTPKDALGEELGMSLEQNAFNAYRSEKLDELVQFPHRKAVSQLQVELLGQLSTTRFLTVSDRFIRELGKHVSSGTPSKEIEARVEHLLKGMRHLKLRVYPENELEMSAEFLVSLAGHFANAHGNNLKCAWAETLTSLLHPVVETATAEVNHPMWSKAVTIILQRALQMTTKPRYWSLAFPLTVVSLGVSPREVFMDNWQGCMDSIMTKLKDRNLRNIAMNSFIRLLWVYLNRCTESSTSTRKRLESVIRHMFPSHPGLLYSPEIPFEPFITILHYVMSRQFDYGEELVLEFMRDAIASRGDGTSVEIVSPDRATVSMRAVLFTLRSLELEKPATWPQTSDFSTFSLEGFESSGSAITTEINSDVLSFLKTSGPVIGRLIGACDKYVGNLLLSNDNVSPSSHASSSTMEGSEKMTKKHGDIYASYSARHEPILRLLRSLLESLPRCLQMDVNLPQICDIVCRATFSADPTVCEAADQAVERFSEDPEYCPTLSEVYRGMIFETRHVFKDTFVGSRLLESQFERIVKRWTTVLQALVGHQRIASAQNMDIDDEDIAPISQTIIEKVEGAALFLLCSGSLALRRLAGPILVIARDLEGPTRRPSAAFRYSRISPDTESVSRVIQLFEGTLIESDIEIIKKLPWLNATDKHRLDVVSKDRAKMIPRVAESDHSKDGSLWLALLPYFVGRLDQLPGALNALKSIICQTVIRLQVHVAVVASGVNANPASRTTSDAAVLADHWRAYLSVLCVTLSVNTQVSTPQVKRLKDTVILSPDTITTPPSLFAYLISLLAWEDGRFRDTAVFALGSIRQNLLRPLSELLLNNVRRLADGSKLASPRRASSGSLWTACAHIFRLISPLILDARSPSNLSSMIGFVKVTHTMLSDSKTKEDYDLQSLRRSFCHVVENLTNSLAKLDGSDRFLGDDLRGAIFKLCYEWCHVGRRPDIAKARESQTLQAANESYRGERDRAQYLDDLQAKTKLLSAAAAEAMAGLCQGQLISGAEASPAQQASDSIVEPLAVLRWIRGMFSSSSSSHHDTARRALYAILKWNHTSIRLLDEVLHQSYGEGEQFTLESSFFGVVADVMVEGVLILPIEQVACLALSKLGHKHPDIRQRAFQLAESLQGDATARLATCTLLSSVGSSAPNIYRQAQKEMACKLAPLYADHALAFLAECTTRLSQLEAPRRQATMSILPPWLNELELSSDPDCSPEEAAQEHQALSNLVYLAMRFSDDHLDEISEIFTSFAGSGSNRNTTVLVKFLFEQGGKRRSPEFVSHAQQIMACLASSPAGDKMFDEIVNFVEPSAMAAMPEAEIPPSPMSSLANLDSLMSSSRSQTFSTGQLALLFAGELLPHREVDIDLCSRLPTLLHVALVHCDHASPVLRDQAQSILFQVLRTWICDTTNVPSGDGAAIWSNAEAKITALSRARSSSFWKGDDEGDTAFLAPAKMTAFVLKVLGILLPLHPRLRQQWGELALSWATSCPIRHFACRSFQVFRVLMPRVSARMVSDTLARLSSTIASASPEIQSFNKEVLRTFASIVQNLTSTEFANHPQIFWCSVACLTTPFEGEFAEVIELLSHVLDKTNLSDKAVVQHLLSFRPPDWVGPPPHLQALLLIGLRSSKTAFMSFDLIRRLSSAPYDDLIDSPTDRLLHGFVAALPWMLHSTDVGEPNQELANMAEDLAAVAEQQGNAGFSRLLTSFARMRFRSKDDFIRQAASLLRDYMSTHALDIVTLLLGFVLNSHDWMREKSMQVLKLILQFSEARAPLAAHGNELLQPLLRLVSTKHSAQALDVLDMPITTNEPTSLSASGEIFGPIGENGWSVARAKELSALTRENVSAVFNTCAVETRAASAHFSVVQFADIRAFGANPSQVSLDLPSPVSMSDNASMGDLVGALHSLNQFFDDGMEAGGGSIGSPLGGLRSGLKGHGRNPSESASERRVRAIMARAANGRNNSISSPIYETSTGSPTYPYGVNGRFRGQPHQHQHSTSETLNSEDSLSSMGDDQASITQRLDRRDTEESLVSLGRHRVNNQSMSSMGETDSEFDKSENLFGFEEDGNAISVGDESMGSTATGYSLGYSIENVDRNGSGSGTEGLSTPVLMKKGGNGRFGFLRSGSATPSPRDREHDTK